MPSLALIYAFSARLSAALLAFGSIIFLSRTTDTDWFALYIFTFVTGHFFSFLITMGCDMASIRILAQSASEKTTVLRSLIVSALLLFSLTIALSILIMDSFLRFLIAMSNNVDFIPSLGTIAFLAISVSARLFVSGVLRGLGDQFYSATNDGFLAYLFFVLFLFVLYSIGAKSSPNEIILILASLNVLISVMALFAAYKLESRQNIIVEGAASVRSLFALGLPMMVPGVTSFALAQFSLSITYVFGSVEDVAAWGVALQFSNVLYLPTIITHVLLAPQIARASSMRDRKKIADLAALYGAFSFALTLIGTFLFLLANAYWIDLLFGPAYRDYLLMFNLLVAARFVESAFGLPHTTLMMAGEERAHALIRVTTLPFAIGLVFLGAQFFGTAGLALAFMINWIVLNLAFALRSRNRFSSAVFPVLGLLKVKRRPN